ncbi:MAG: ATP-binding protein [Verrucomicrobiota bacterium]|nr:ATP-binding protein [Verrucomicrobiota bacterium]
MKIYIPNSAFLGNVDTFIRSFDAANPLELKITFNPKWVSAHPFVLSVVGALGKSALSRGVQPIIEAPNAKFLPYFIRMGLFDFLNVPRPTEIIEHEAAGRFIPLAQVRNSLELQKFITDMIPLLHATPEEAEPIQYVMSELIRNVLEHSASSLGATVCAQYFKTTKRISIGVSDSGIGIRKAMAIHSPKSNREAIGLALKPGITGTTVKFGGTETNAGAGLFFTWNIAKSSKNFFVIWSEDSFYKLLKPKGGDDLPLQADPFIERATIRSDLPLWQGTVVGIDISTLPNQGFSGLLEKIRNVYSLDVRRKKREFFKRPRFI